MRTLSAAVAEAISSPSTGAGGADGGCRWCRQPASGTATAPSRTARRVGRGRSVIARQSASLARLGRLEPARPRTRVKENMGGGVMAAVSRQRVREVLEPVVTHAGYDLEDVTVTAAGRRSVVRVVVDR